MDLNKAIQSGQLVNAAYAVPPENLSNRVGEKVDIDLSAGTIVYQVIATIYGNDLATDMNPLRGSNRVSFGLILQTQNTGDVVIALRGTEGIMEWVQDAKFLTVPCPFLSGAGNTEDGFTGVYKSLTVDLSSGAPSLTKALTGLDWPRPVSSVTVCGHSLGGALATLLGLDLAANSPRPFNAPVVYTYASPRTGDACFVATYDHVVPNTSRIANRMDLVPKLPLPPLYEHVLGLFELNPIKLGTPSSVLIKCDIPCEHFLSSYLHLLSQLIGESILPLDPKCIPRLDGTL